MVMNKMNYSFILFAIIAVDRYFFYFCLSVELNASEHPGDSRLSNHTLKG